MSEAELQKSVANFIKHYFPFALFHSDFGSGAKLTPRQAATQKAQNAGRRAWPDIFIAEPAPCSASKDEQKEYHGLFVELKREGVRLKKKNGDWATRHIAEQAEVLKELRKRGYKAEFAVGYGEATRIIDNYFFGGI